MLRTSATVLVTVLALSGCGLTSVLEHEEDDTPPTVDSCEGVMCGPCPPALSLRVAGEPGKPAPEVTLTGVTGSCGEGPQGVTQCWLDVYAPGSYAFEVHAPGYKPVAVRETVAELIYVGACCNCGYQDRVLELTLERP